MAATPKTTDDTWSDAISKDDHGPLVSITTCLMLVGMLLSLFIRLAIRWPWKQLMGFDDIATLVASILALAQSVTTFEAIHCGLGRHESDVSPTNLADMEKSIYAGDILFVLVLTGSKLALSLLILRLASSKQHILATNITTGFIIAWGFAATLAVAIRPNISQPWQLGFGAALHVTNVWVGVATVSILLELAIVMIPIFLVWGLQMPLKSKLAVIVGFGFRIPAIIISILRIASFQDNAHQIPQDTPWLLVSHIIYTEIEMHYSLIAATIPCMRIFLKNFNTGYLGTTAEQVDPTSTMIATKGSDSYPMSSIRSRQQENNSRNDGERKDRMERDLRDLKLRGDEGMTITRVHHPETLTDSGSQSSDGSDKIIVKKTVQVDLGYPSK